MSIITDILDTIVGFLISLGEKIIDLFKRIIIVLCDIILAVTDWLASRAPAIIAKAKRVFLLIFGR